MTHRPIAYTPRCMINFLLVILATGGMLAIGWFVWRGLEAQEASSTEDKADHKPNVDDDASANE